MSSTVKEAPDGSTELKMQALAKVYIDKGGNLKKIERAIGIKFKEDAHAKDAKDFAKQFLDRTFT